ncbi:hypothetical protein BDN72DRAFT_846212 [Pluteus cervinus]|uniref:Uncharacterized protein n=1 Tax=Pluteus cervinus TaxID=181527 RepID=A0ACD3AGZ9_9AGAR|nr:hypothetical protein BDN72DRAFT_846212 [Pluteus cervinus]
MSQLPPHPILQQHFDSSQAAFSQIDKELAALQESIRVLHAFRNTFTPVYRLPAEVLTRIFGLVQHICSHEVDTASPQWVVVTCISQHWRDVAVGCPSLWSQITDTFPKHITSEWIQRSKDIPLYITSNLSSVADLQFIETSLFRIRELKLSVLPNTWNDLLSQILSSPAPLLESLCFSITASDSRAPLSMISDDTFAGKTPSLRRMELTGCPVNIRSSIFTDLTALELNDPPQPLSAADIITALHELPCLTSLKLVNVLESGIPGISTDIDRATLSSLEFLQIKGTSFPQDLDILSHISFPINTALQFSSETEAGGAIALLLDFLNVHKSSRQQSSTVVVDLIDLQYVYHLLMLDINSKHSDAGYVVGLVKFDVSGPWLNETVTVSNTASLLSSFDLKSLTYLGIMNCRLPTETWTDLFGSLPKLNLVTTTGPSGITFLSSIINDHIAKCVTQPKPQATTSTKGKKRKGKGAGGKLNPQVASTSTSVPQAVDWVPIFPSLETIQVTEMVFINTFVEDLLAAFHARKEIEKEIKKFVMSECENVDQGVVGMLREVVGHVEWDGWTGTDPENDPQGEYMYGPQAYEMYNHGVDEYEWGGYVL